jgi:hypothetical protein
MALDIIFISYDEPHAEEHFQLLVDHFPHAKRVHGIKGIREAHLAAANTAQTSSFFVVDGDCEITEKAEEIFAYKPPSYDKKYMHLWNSLNPVNGLIYGYGGIKLFSKSMFQDVPSGKYVDFSTSLGDGIKMMSSPNEYGSITHFNSSPFLAFRGALREVAKLTTAKDAESIKRLDVWMNHSEPDARYQNEVMRGAMLGYATAMFNEDISVINDIEWLKRAYVYTIVE